MEITPEIRKALASENGKKSWESKKNKKTHISHMKLMTQKAKDKRIFDKVKKSLSN